MRKLRINKLSEAELKAAEEERRLKGEIDEAVYSTGHFFIMDEDHNIYPATGGEMQTTEERRVGLYDICGFQISTIFLGINYSLTNVPALFGSAIISPSGDMHIIDRYATYNQALEAHQILVFLSSALEYAIFDDEEDVINYIQAAYDEVQSFDCF